MCSGRTFALHQPHITVPSLPRLGIGRFRPVAGSTANNTWSSYRAIVCLLTSTLSCEVLFFLSILQAECGYQISYNQESCHLLPSAIPSGASRDSMAGVIQMHSTLRRACQEKYAGEGQEFEYRFKEGIVTCYDAGGVSGGGGPPVGWILSREAEDHGRKPVGIYWQGRRLGRRYGPTVDGEQRGGYHP